MAARPPPPTPPLPSPPRLRRPRLRRRRRQIASTRRLQIDTKHGQVCLIPIKIVCLSPRLLSHFSSDWYMAQGHVQSLRCMDVLLLDLFRGSLMTTKGSCSEMTTSCSMSSAQLESLIMRRWDTSIVRVHLTGVIDAY
ncbi:uncharacterized protein LOC119275110 isoform X3 [Triticum dicoccoides]|uniref:uncharacterized protein LOC119275110 isoform X3 n=1 Tax=Triticum dicoccoides TaxID=85692 RepID=UPI00188E2633|nr:uncharacterized protein LOC119275110 isoform X3 [Triticum dicoccoides]XP_044347578.1 uncharacterized protein LOC123068940 isoform X1 [Triticum aestivum]